MFSFISIQVSFECRYSITLRQHVRDNLCNAEADPPLFLSTDVLFSKNSCWKQIKQVKMENLQRKLYYKVKKNSGNSHLSHLKTKIFFTPQPWWGGGAGFSAPRFQYSLIRPVMHMSNWGTHSSIRMHACSIISVLDHWDCMYIYCEFSFNTVS